MQITKVRGCESDDCPAVYETDRGTLVVRGAVVTDPEVLARANVPQGEMLVEVPREVIAGL